MECKDSRKKLKDYALSRVKSPEKEALEAHIEHCQVCIRELAMWQDVLSRQKFMEEEKDKSSLAARVQQTAGKLNSEIYMVPAARRLNYVAKTLKSPVGMIILVTSVVIFGVAVLFIFIKKEISPLFYILMILGGMSLIFVTVRAYFTGKKK